MLKFRCNWLSGLLALGVVIFSLAFIKADAAAGNIKLAGSTTLFPLLQRVAEIYMQRYPMTFITVAGRGSTDGVSSLLAGLADAAGISRPLSPKEKALARNKGINFSSTPVALDAVVMAVNPRNPVANLSLEQLAQVYNGRISNWKELGGEDLPITVLARESNSGTFKFMQTRVMSGGRIRPDALILASNGLIVQEVMRNPRALGYVGLGYLNSRLKALNVDGVKPDGHSVRSAHYPLTRKLYLLIPDPPSKEVKVYLELLLSELGQKTAIQKGLTPLR